MKNQRIRFAAAALSLASLLFALTALSIRIYQEAKVRLQQEETTSVNLYIDRAVPWNKGVVTKEKPSAEFLTTQHHTTNPASENTQPQSTEAKDKAQPVATEKQTEPPTVVTEPEPITEPAAQVNSDSGSGSLIGTMYITGYTAEEGFPEGSATASGYGVRSGYCALNDSQRRSLGISYGDRIYVEGLGTYTVMDCGCGWGVVDIWVYSNAEAYAITGNYRVYYA